MSNLNDDYDRILFGIEDYLIQNGAPIYLHFFLCFNYDKIRSGEVTMILAPSDDVMQRLSTQVNKTVIDISEIPEGIDFLSNFLSAIPINDSYPVYMAINGTTFGQTRKDLSKLNFMANGEIGNVVVAVINSGISRNQQQITTLTYARQIQDIKPNSNIIGGNLVTHFEDFPNPIIRQIVLNLRPIDIINLCRLNSQFNTAICRSEDFWNEKTRKDRPTHRGMINGSWKETYRLTGRLYTFGNGDDGRLGHGDTENQLRPKLVYDLTNVTAVSCGPVHTAVISNNQLYTFGQESYNPTGQLWPKLEERLTNVTAISAGEEATDVISNGKLYLYYQIDYSKFDDDSQVFELENTPPNITFVSDSTNLSHEAIIANGQLYTKGRGENGELGLGDVDETDQFTLVDVDENMQKLDNVTAVSCGYHHTAVISNGRLYTFGNGRLGRLGHGDQQDRRRPKLVEGLANVTFVSCGASHTAVVSNGQLYTFGDGSNGELGHGNQMSYDRPILVEGLNNVTVVACAYVHTAVVSNGQLYTFGSNQYGQLGHGDKQDQNRPKLVEGLTSIVAVSCGFSHTAAIVG